MNLHKAKRAGGNGAQANGRTLIVDADRPSIAGRRDDDNPDDEGPRLRFLRHFDKSRWGVVTNHFLGPLREGRAETPQAVVNAVIYKLERQIESAQRWNQPCHEQHAELDVIIENEGDALGFARVCIEYLALPAEERQRIKARRRQDGIAQWMGDRAPSPRQLTYLQSLGHTGPVPATMLEASRLIDARVQARRGGRRDG